MGGYDEHVAIIGDWMPPPSPSPRAFFSAMLGDAASADDIGGLRSISEPTGDNRNGTNLFQQRDSRISSRDDNHENRSARGQGSNSLEQKIVSRGGGGGGGGGLLERRAGFNAPRLNTESIRPPGVLQNPDVIRSPYLTIPPGLSPTTLLDSPVFLSNSLVQPSPTTGKFQLPLSGNGRSSMFMKDGSDKTTDNFFDSFTSSSFAFKPVAESTPSLFLGAASKATPSTLTQQSFRSIDVSVQSDRDSSVLPRKVEPANVSGAASFHLQADFSRSSAEKDDVGVTNISSEPSRSFDHVGGCAENSPPLDEEQEADDPDQRVSGDNNVGSAPSDDGYNWRKYGQKQVKGSEYPRSYYKCTHPNCPVKKKVERSHEGHITEIIYKGTHNHPKPPSNCRTAIGSSNAISSDMQSDGVEQAVEAGDHVWTTVQNRGGADWRKDNVEVTSSGPLGTEYGNNASKNLQTQYESVGGGPQLDCSSTFSNEDEDDRATHGSASLGYDGEGDESESKRRKIEAYAAADVSGATRAIREPRVVVQTTSEVDILDDGYRWRKYGQKVVKGNPNPRSYYKCTNAGCSVRKHVERASHDLKSVITTYEGKHNHDVPAARNSSHMVNANTTISSSSSQSIGGGGGGLSQIHRPATSQLQNNMARFERPHSLASFGLQPGMNHRQQFGGGGGLHGFGFGMNQPGQGQGQGQGLANMAMAGFGSNQGKMGSAAMQVRPSYLGNPPRPMNEMAEFMMPKGEPKVEPVSEPGLDLTNDSSFYHQIMSRLPLGPHM